MSMGYFKSVKYSQKDITYKEWFFFAIYHAKNCVYSRDKKGTYPYYISPIEIGLLWVKIAYLKSHSIALAFGLHTDIK